MDEVNFRNYRISHEARIPFEEGYHLHMDGRFEDACECYKRSLEIRASAEAHTFLGWALSRLGRLEEAIAQCRCAIAVDPEFGNPYNDIGAYLIELDRLDEAEEWLAKAKHAQRYDNPEFPRCNMGRLFQLKGNPYRAMCEFQEALEVQPECVRARLALMRLAPHDN